MSPGALLCLLLGVAALWVALELIVRAVLERPLRTDFYGSIPRQRVRNRQRQHGLRACCGPGWVHLGWIADPERERYRIELREGDGWRPLGGARWGSFLTRRGGRFRVRALPRGGGKSRILGELAAQPTGEAGPILAPRVVGPWRPLFRPSRAGFYVNDHAIYRDAEGGWRLVGITDRSDGDFSREARFAVGVSRDFPPPEGMEEADPVADFGERAWAPHVIENQGVYHLFWSPHRLHHMTSPDGIRWEGHRIAMAAPHHRFFRDATVLQVAERQWLLYCTARGRYYSRVDIYQSFDLEEWQYIRPALVAGWGSERNSPFASMESPSVVHHRGRYYLALTYNNDSFFWPGLLLLVKKWPGRASYNDTMVFQADNPYHFGVYRGRRKAPALLTRIRAHAPRFVRHPETGSWYVTTAGWPWVATLTSGEVAVAPLEWEPVSERTPEETE